MGLGLGLGLLDDYGGCYVLGREVGQCGLGWVGVKRGDGLWERKEEGGEGIGWERGKEDGKGKREV